jgi:hypothetical protein
VVETPPRIFVVSATLNNGRDIAAEVCKTPSDKYKVTGYSVGQSRVTNSYEKINAILIIV